MSDETTPKAPETEASAPETKPEAQPAEAKSTAAQPDAPDQQPAARAPKAAGDGEKPAKPPKKEKPPALEDKPFPEFIEQHFLPALKQTLAKVGLSDLDLQFEKRKLPIAALGDSEYWQVIGHWQGGQRQFNILFSKEDIQAPKFFTCADQGAEPTLLESFMIDERKVNLDLLLLYTVQRLNGQKWLVMN